MAALCEAGGVSKTNDNHFYHSIDDSDANKYGQFQEIRANPPRGAGSNVSQPNFLQVQVSLP